MASLARHRNPHAGKTFPLPDPNDIRSSKTEYIYDVDLDEFSILIYGRERRSTQNDLAENFATLLDPRSKEVVGYVFGDFSTWIERIPQFSAYLPKATKLVGDRIIPAGHVQTESPSFRERARTSFYAWFPTRSEAEDLRRALEKVEDMCLV